MSKKNKLQLKPFLIFTGAWAVYFSVFWRRAFYYANGALEAGHINIWGDWAAHMTMTTAMAERGFQIGSPFLYGANFSYPFVANAISALLINLGLDITTAMVGPSWLFSILLVAAVYIFYNLLFKKPVWAILAAFVFLLNGGLGWWFWASDISTSMQPFTDIINPVHEYTRLDSQGIKWINIIDSMVIPQRAFTLGFGWAVAAVSLIYWLQFSKSKLSKPYLRLCRILSGVAVGFLPVIHTHSFLALAVILSGWATSDLIYTYFNQLKRLQKRLGEWLEIGISAIVVAGVLWKMFFAGHVGSSFLQIAWGWLAPEYNQSIFTFWILNWGLVPILAVVGWLLLIKKKQTQLALSLWPFLAIFVLANIVQFQPFAWDNTKLFVWASLGMSALATLVIKYLVNLKHHRLQISIFASLMYLSMIASGALDAYWILRTDQHTYTMHTAEETQLASWVKNNTSSSSLWLAGDNHNHWLFNATGRQTMLTFRGWLWTHGYDYQPIENDARQMLAKPADNLDLYEKYGVEYVVVGPNEIEVWGANPTQFAKVFTIVHSSENYTIFSVD